MYTDKDGPAVRLTIPYEAIVLFDVDLAAQPTGALGPRKRLDPIPSMALTRVAH